MMRSLFSGVSGLKNHQTRMDVIGNNISNVNTTGFKSSRVTFNDMLSQTVTGASAPAQNRGGTNAKQVGLGSTVASVDLMFTNGSVQSTGKNTDIAMSGNGLFVVKRGTETFYTRNGAFEFDADGNYVQPGNGLFVQGWMAQNGKLTTTGETTNITIPAGKSMDSQATKMANYTNNLNGDPDGYEITNMTVNYADGTTALVTNYTPTRLDGAASGAITIKVQEAPNQFSTYVLDSTAAASVAVGDTLSNFKVHETTVKSVTANSTGTVALTIDSANLPYVSVDPAASLTGVTSGTYVYGGNYSVTQKITAAVADNVNHQITLTLDNTTGTRNGEAVTNGLFTKVVVPMPENSPVYKVGDDFTTTVPITNIAAATGATVALADGTEDTLTAALTVDEVEEPYDKKVSGTVVGLQRIEDTIFVHEDKEVASVSINTPDGTVLNGLPGQTYATHEVFYPSVVTTMTVYDSQGGSHDIPLIFSKKTGEDNTWGLTLQGGSDKYSFTEANLTKTEVSLTSTDLKFDENGAYVSGSGTLKFKFGNGAADQEVLLNMNGLTQYIGSSTISADADGHAAGTLSSVAIDSSGIITGTYTNGVRQYEAQIAVAQFNNASGLTKTGESLYQESNNSGVANIHTADDLGVTLTPSSLEMSNVDVANEFTDMIVTQRGFQSNSKIITVSDEMLETLINLKR